MTSTSRRLRDGLALIGGLAVGVVVALGVGWLRDQTQADALVYSPDERTVTVTATADVERGAATPDEAVVRFLEAEVANDADASFELLSRADRQTILTVNGWDRTRASRLGRVISFTPVDLEIDDAQNAAVATTTLELVSALDRINGLTPPFAALELHLVDDDGWRVDLANSVFTPDYRAAVEPDTTAAAAAAIEWIRAGAACTPLAAAGELATFRNSLPSLTEQLCSMTPMDADTEAAIVGPPTDLGSAQAANGLSATFGSSVRDWAAIVPVFAPVSADLVLAPVGDRWVVIDVLPR